ncbi:hypothetical protein CXB51_022036 [Gossypium anomalum]|uniref:RNase H type-1 domain-containing protein n=1 Tax=Gossypium anomalum TaxID=47600 RepID=A0A8J5YGQ6_9ROSI|nr:hypothetical protein CXB51_022036 [Gossypium anomalum]
MPLYPSPAKDTVDKASFTWRSIAATASVLKSGFGWQVGCGDLLEIFGIGKVDDGIRVESGKSMAKILEKKFATYQSGMRITETKCKLDLALTSLFGERLGNLTPSLRLAFSLRECGADYETLIHALKDCLSSKATLMLGGLDSSVISKEYDRCIDWLEDLMRVLDKKAMVDFTTILWNCWNSRNNLVFNGKEEEPKDIWSKASGGGGFKDGQLSAEEAEWHAFDESIKIACCLNIKGDVLFESDCARLVNKINGQNKDLTIIGERIKDSLKAFVHFLSATCVWTSRHCNTVADFICKKMCAGACY